MSIYQGLGVVTELGGKLHQPFSLICLTLIEFTYNFYIKHS